MSKKKIDFDEFAERVVGQIKKLENLATSINDGSFFEELETLDTEESDRMADEITEAIEDKRNELYD
jgi:hypothetical protein